VAKAKTPSTGGDKPTQNLTSRASSAASKPKTTAKTPTKTTAAEAKQEAPTKKTETVKTDTKTEAGVKEPEDITKSVASDTKQDVTPIAEAPKAESTKPAVTDTTKDKVETASPSKEAEKKAEPTKQTEAPKASDVSSKPPQTTPPEPAKTTQAEPQKSGSVFFPMLFGGIIAGAIGFAAAEMNVLGLRPDRTTNPDVQTAFEADLAAQQARIAALEQATPETSAAPEMPDMSPVEDALEEITANVAALTTRIDEIENRPVRPAAQAPELDTSAFEAELAGLKASVETQRDEIQKLLENALSVEEATAQAAQAATAQSAISRIVSAITTGQPFATEVAELQAIGTQDVPPALSDVGETGVVTSANLQDRFPDAARAALSAARANAPTGEGSGFGNFLKNQLGARSVTPREGDDPDAVLSRAEAAMRDGRLADALTEVQVLPAEAKAPLADWIADAQSRQAAQDAVDTLTQRLTAN